MSTFSGAAEFRRVFDLLFDSLSRDPDTGPRLRDLRCPMRFDVKDLDLILIVMPAGEKRARSGQHLEWLWGVSGKTPKVPKGSAPEVTLSMSSQVANRYFQGKENVPLGVARGTIVVEDGPLARVLDMLPIVLPFHRKWRARLESEGLSRFVV